MKKLMLLVPLCICVIAGMVMSGCGTSDIVNIPAAIVSLTLTGTGDDIAFDFTYIDNPDVTGTFLVHYALVSAPDTWTPAIVLAGSGGSEADLTGKEPGEYTFYWDTDSLIPNANVQDGDYIFRVRIDKSDAVPDIPDTNTKLISVSNGS